MSRTIAAGSVVTYPVGVADAEAVGADEKDADGPSDGDVVTDDGAVALGAPVVAGDGFVQPAAATSRQAAIAVPRSRMPHSRRRTAIVPAAAGVGGPTRRGGGDLSCER
jgi:hypothetical protein